MAEENKINKNEQKKEPLQKKLKQIFKHLKNSSRRINSQIKITAILTFRSRLTIFLFFALPLIILLLFGSIFAKQQSFRYDLTVQNHDNSIVSEELIQKLEANQFLRVSYLTDLTVDPKEFMEQNQIHACLVIPQHWFENSIINGYSEVILFVNPYVSSSDRIVRLVGNVINEFNLERNNSSPLVNLETEVFYSNNINYIDFFLPGIIGVVIMNIALIGTVMRQSHYKKIGIFKKFATTPLTHFEFQTSEITFHFIITFLATFLSILAGWFFFGFSLTSINAMLLPIIFTGVILFTGIGLMISLFTKSPRSSLLISLAVVIPLMILSGVFFDISSIKVLTILSKFSPLTYVIEALRASMITNNYSQAWLNIGITLIIGLVLLIVGNFLTRWEKL
ncbi:MAG: ABC transporter permease [Candidatus Heimdallarchaeota archaeon]